MVLRLKDLSFLNGLPSENLEWIFDLWWARAKSVVRTDDRDYSWKDFAAAWRDLTFGIRHCRIGRLVEAELDRPDEDLPAVPDELYEHRNDFPTRRLIAVVRLFGRLNGTRPFPLSRRFAAAVCGFSHDRRAGERIEQFRKLRNPILKRETRGVAGEHTPRIAATYTCPT